MKSPRVISKPKVHVIHPTNKIAIQCKCLPIKYYIKQIWYWKYSLLKTKNVQQDDYNQEVVREIWEVFNIFDSVQLKQGSTRVLSDFSSSLGDVYNVYDGRSRK